MKKMKLLWVSLLGLYCSGLSAQSLDATTAWWNNETFESYTVSANATAWTFVAGNGSASGTTSYSYKNPATNTGNAAGIVLSISNPSYAGATFSEPNANRQLEVVKSFSNNLTGYVYAKYSGYTCTRGTAYTFLNSDGNAVFGVQGQNGSATLKYQLTKPTSDGTYVTGTSTAFSPSTGNVRTNWFQVEMLLNLSGSTKEVVKIKTTVGTTVQTYGPITLTNGTNISQFHAITGKYNAIGLDNVSIGNLVADNISTLTGGSELQTLSSQVNSTYSVTALASIASLSVSNITIAGGNSDINWSISDYGALSEADKALVSINRSATNHAEAVLTTTGAVSSDATITLSAVLGSTTVTKQVLLKSSSLDGVKANLLSEIGNATTLNSNVSASNTYLSDLKNALSTAISTANSVYTNSVSASEIADAKTALQTAETTFSSGVSVYTSFGTAITTVTSNKDAEVRTAPFFVALKSTLSDAITVATAAKDTFTVATGIAVAQATLNAANDAFNANKSYYTNLQTSITAVSSRFAVADARKGDTKFLMFPTLNVDALSSAKTAAQSVLDNGTTTTELGTAKTDVDAALVTFNAASRVTPSSNYYRIFTYGADGGDGGGTKNVLTVHNTGTLEAPVYSLKYSPVANATSLAFGDSAQWSIAVGSANNKYTLLNKATGLYMAGAGLSATSYEQSFPEVKSQFAYITGFYDNATKLKIDPNFIYAIVTAGNKALEVDVWTAPYGVFIASYTAPAPDRYRYAFQFEEVVAQSLSTSGTLTDFTTNAFETATQTLSLTGANLFGDIALSLTGANASKFSVSPTSINTVNTGLVATTVTINYSPISTRVDYDLATLSIVASDGTTLTYNLQGVCLTTGAKSLTGSFSAYAVNRNLIVNGANAYDVYNVQGSKVASVAVSSANAKVSLMPGVYVVKAAGKVQKVLVK